MTRIPLPVGIAAVVVAFTCGWCSALAWAIHLMPVHGAHFASATNSTNGLPFVMPLTR